MGQFEKIKPELPLQLLCLQDRQIKSTLFAFTKKMALVSYVPKKGKNVLLLSTKHREPQVEEGAKKRPQIILDYNKCKGAMGNLDRIRTRLVFSITLYKAVLSYDVLFCFAGVRRLHHSQANPKVAHMPFISYD